MPQLSDLFSKRQIAWIWLVSKLVGAAGGAVVASPLLTGGNLSPGEWVLLILGAGLAVFSVLSAAASEDPRTMEPIHVEGIGDPKP